MSGTARMRTLGILALACLPALSSAPAHALRGSQASAGYAWVGTLSSGGDGVVIAPNWVLTAAHVAQPGGSVRTAAGSARIESVYKAGAAGFPDDDLALLYLDSGLAFDDFPILSGSVLSARTAIDLGAVTLVAAESATSRHLVSSALITAYPTLRTPDDVEHSVWYLAAGSPADSSPILQAGDSGSGLFAGHGPADEPPLLLGIASASCNTRYSCYVQPSAYREWMDATMAQSGQSALWTPAAVPEPVSAVLLAAGLAAVGLAARRKGPRR